MKRMFFFFRWAIWLFLKGHAREAVAAFLEAFDKGRAERQARQVLFAAVKTKKVD